VADKRIIFLDCIVGFNSHCYTLYSGGFPAGFEVRGTVVPKDSEATTRLDDRRIDLW
jgi:hypothetical protein